MIIAILEDKKLFLKSIQIPYKLGSIFIPEKPPLNMSDLWLQDESLKYKKIEFRFYKWIKKGEIALYRES